MNSPLARRVAGRLPLLLPFFLVVALGALLRWHEIGRQSLWLDEVWEAKTASLALHHGFFESVRSQTAAAPLDYLGVKAVVKFLGFGTVAPRVWAFLMGVVAIAAIAWAARGIFRSNATALVAAALLALSGYHVFFSQEARPYAMYVTVGIVIVGTFHAAVVRNRRRDWTLLAAVVATALYTHYFLAFIVAACGLGLLIGAITEVRARHGARDVAWPWLRRGAGFTIAVLVAAAAFVPWFLFAGAGQLIGVDHGHPPLEAFSARWLDQVFLSILAVARDGSAWNPISLVYARALEILAIVGFVTSRPWRSPSVMALGLTALLVVPAVYLADSWAHYFFSLRQVIVILIPVYLLAAAGSVWAWHRAVALLKPRPRTRLIAVAGLGVALAIGAWPGLAATYASTYKPDWRDASGLIASGACPDARVYVSYGDFEIRYYHADLKMVTGAWSLYPSLAETQRLALQPDDWVVIYTPRVPERTEDQIAAHLEGLGYHRTRFNQIDVFGQRHLCSSPAQ